MYKVMSNKQRMCVGLNQMLGLRVYELSIINESKQLVPLGELRKKGY